MPKVTWRGVGATKCGVRNAECGIRKHGDAKNHKGAAKGHKEEDERCSRVYYELPWGVFI